jgi:hypothetical protein
MYYLDGLMKRHEATLDDMAEFQRVAARLKAGKAGRAEKAEEFRL